MQRLETKVLDKETGELVQVEITTFSTVKAEEFVQVYLNKNATLFGLSTFDEIAVMEKIILLSNYYDGTKDEYGNKVYLVKNELLKIATSLGVSLSCVRNIITSLVKKKIIFRDATNIYYLNPMYFFRGKISDRTKCVKLIQEYKIV